MFSSLPFLTCTCLLFSPTSLLFPPTDNVEMEIVLPGDMTVMESHDIALALQHKVGVPHLHGRSMQFVNGPTWNCPHAAA